MNIINFKKTRKRGLWFVLIGLGILIWWGFNNIWRSPAYYPKNVNDIQLSAPVLSSEEYNLVIETHERPYIVQISNESGAVLLYGAEHTRDPLDPQISDIESKWKDFSPSVAFVEGRLDFLMEGFMNPVSELGEGGWVNKLARDNGVPSFTWELKREDEVALMLQSLTKEQVALYYFLRPYVSSLRFGKPENPDEALQRYIDERVDILGLGDTIKTVKEVDVIWQRDFRGLPDWRDTSDQYGWPGYLNQVAEQANTIRNEHLARLIVYLVQRGERVFVVAGSAHAVSLHNTLQTTLTK